MTHLTYTIPFPLSFHGEQKAIMKGRTWREGEREGIKKEVIAPEPTLALHHGDSAAAAGRVFARSPPFS